ncbi:MAG: cupin-like domain-containing protein [Pseudomonadales bacterium]|nr:cupin-like domain-containing protein [Pseudomonadales bacterium]
MRSGEDLAPSVLWRALPCASVVADAGARLRTAIAASEPLVLTDLARDWPALTEWAPERLAARFGDRTVRVYDASFGTPGKDYMGSIDTMRFDAFLAATLGEARDLRMFLYNLARQIPELRDDVRLPEIGLRFSHRFLFSFFGCRGSTTPLHFDIDMGCVVHTVISGRRRVRLFAPEDSARLYRHPFTVRSYVPLDDPDPARYPAFARARGYEVVLEPGESLFMPPGWWHEFHYLEGGMGVSLRAPSLRLADRLAGAGNLLLATPLDRFANAVAPKRWFEWKRRRADARAAACLRAGGRS